MLHACVRKSDVTITAQTFSQTKRSLFKRSCRQVEKRAGSLLSSFQDGLLNLQSADQLMLTADYNPRVSLSEAVPPADA